jgi:hypothetical protein
LFPAPAAAAVICFFRLDHLLPLLLSRLLGLLRLCLLLPFLLLALFFLVRLVFAFALLLFAVTLFPSAGCSSSSPRYCLRLPFQSPFLCLSLVCLQLF